MVLKGKRIDFLGDSITEGVGVNDRPNNRFDNILKRECDLREVHNYGVGGTRFAHQSVPSEKPRFDLCFCGRAYDIDPSADIVVVYGGINDYIHGDAPFGKIGEMTPATFCGATYFLMKKLTDDFRGKAVVFMTPAHCFFDGWSDAEPSKNPRKRDDAKPLIDYVNVIKETAKQFSIPVLDLYHDLGIDPNHEADRRKYTSDGLHFNDAGHHVVATRLKAFLEAL